MALHKRRHPRLPEPGQRPALALVRWRPGQLPQLLKVLLKGRVHHLERGPVALFPHARLLPHAHLLLAGHLAAPGQHPRRVDGLPLKDLERQARAHRADKQQRRVLAPHNVLVQPRHAVVAHAHLREKRQRPAVPRAKDEVVDVWDAGAVHEVHGACGCVEARNGWVLLDPRVLEGLVAKIAVVLVPDDDGVHEAVFGDPVGCQVVGDVCARDGRADNNNALV